MKILWVSNAPWSHTGYGNQTNTFWWRIAKLGHNVVLGANYGLRGAPLNISAGGENTRVLPAGYTTHGSDILAPHARYVKADIVITLYDPWAFPPHITSSFRWCPWMPVDHEPLPERVYDAVRGAYQPIAYSRFGERALQEAGLDPRYVPHGVDRGDFFPEDKAESLRRLNLPRDDVDFLAVMVAANKGTPSRKAFPEVFMAWAEFVKKHPKAALYVHTHPGPQMSGLDLGLLVRKLGIPDHNLFFCDPYWYILGYPPAYMRAVFSAADVLLSPSYGEGFGLPILEAQACGCPVIVGGWTSMPELCFSGWVVDGQPFYTPLGAWQFVPYIKDSPVGKRSILAAIEEAYKAKGDPAYAKRAREGAAQYNADEITEKYWKPVLEEIEQDIGDDPLLDDSLVEVI